MADPLALLAGFGLDQACCRSLPRITQLSQQLPHVPGMIGLIEFVLNDLTDQWRGPDAGFQTISHRTAVQNITELLALSLTEAGRPAAALALPKPFLAAGVPVLDPERHRAAMNLELVGNVAGRVPIQAHENSLHAKHQARKFFPPGFPANLQKFFNCLAISFGKYRGHICLTNMEARLAIVELFMRVHRAGTTAKFDALLTAILDKTFFRLLPPGGIRRDEKENYENAITNTRHLPD